MMIHIKPKASDEAYDYAFNLDEIDTKHFPIEAQKVFPKIFMIQIV